MLASSTTLEQSKRDFYIASYVRSVFGAESSLVCCNEGVPGVLYRSAVAKTYPAVQKGYDGEDDGDVGQHEDDGRPVDGVAVHAVVFHDHVADDGVLDPLPGVACRVQHEYDEDGPSPLVNPPLFTRLLRHRVSV